MTKINAIVAMDEARVIGCDNDLPWHIAEDLKRFKILTSGHAVFMGRKTYESLPPRFRPLPGRKNIVASRSPEKLSLPSEVEVCTDPRGYLSEVKSGAKTFATDLLWIIGGAKIYSLTMPYWDELFLTLVNGEHAGAVRLPEFESEFEMVEKEEHEGFSFIRYQRR